MVSHSQIQVRSRPFDEASSQWRKIDLEQGAIIYKDYVVFDPLPEGSFGANVHLILTKKFEMNENTQRCIVVPFYIINKNDVEIASASEKFKIELSFEIDLYSLYYEVCEGDEIFYKLTFIPSETPINPMYLLDDPWGGGKNKPLVIGQV
ncbi:competence protein ComJ [Brenneria sp. g21c3]|uniref:competence protein ComJ n=1 Tax=Brenneria sp. g21c3 TaxID=3093893 RepID=UPI002EAF5A1F|nr:competence protein ComJ [Brenneria sp. g21c3]